MSSFEKEIETIVSNDIIKGIGTSQANRIEFKEKACRYLMKELKGEDNVDIVLCKAENEFKGVTSEAKGTLILTKYNIEIQIEIGTGYIQTYATYIGNEDIKNKHKPLFRFDGEMTKQWLADKNFKVIKEFLKVKTIEFIYELDKECNGKITNNRNI